ncbi:hypothetical protein M413DRAFT_442259, partial [Hebeloma cylindrosporum]
MAKRGRGGRGDRGFNGGRGGGRGRGGRGGRGAPGASFLQEEIEFSTRMFADANNSGASTPRGNGRGRGRGGQSNSGTNTPSRGRGRGFDSPRGRGRGQPDDFRNRRRSDGIGSSPVRGRGGAQVQPGTLSGLLYLERPLLRPIVFVPSVLTKILFEQEEDLIKPGVEDVDGPEQSDLPTADQVYRVFSGGNIPRLESDNEDEDEDGEEIEEVDFHELGTLFEKISTTNTTRISKSKLAEATTIMEQSFTGFYNNTPSIHPSTITTDVDQLPKPVEEALSPAEEPITSEDSIMSAPPNEEGPLLTATPPQSIIVNETVPQSFHIDLEPTPVPATMAPENELPSALQNNDEEDDVIVYVAPHPRNISTQEVESALQAEPSSTDAVDTSLFTPYVSTVTMSAASASSSMYTPEPPSMSSFSFSFSQSTQSVNGTPGKASARLYVPPITTPRQANAWKHKRGLTKKKRGKSSFGAFGAMREEAQLHNDDPKRAERRRGDSDLDWGDTDDDDVNGVDMVEEGLEGIFGSNKRGLDKGKGKERDVEAVHGMEVDSDVDLAAMQSFVGSLLGADAGQHVTMDDLRDAEIMKMEDEEDLQADDSDSSEEEGVEDVFDAEEAKLISELLNSEDDELDDDTDDDDDDEDQTPRTSFQARLERLRKRARAEKFADSDEDAIIDRNLTWADEDEDFIQKIQDMVDENEAVLTGKDRKQRNALFHSIRDGAFEDLEDFSPAKRRKDRGKDLPPDLQAQWAKDRKAKAEYKKKRELARLEAAADPLSKKKGGKKGRKAMLAAAALDPTINVLPNRVIDMVTLVQQIRRFIDDLGGPLTMSLPPTNKETRKNIHEMAIAFNLKSISKGKGDARYTTLTKTTKTGAFIDEKKVSKIMRRSGGMGARGDSFIYDKKGRGAPVVMPRHREGEEVGKAAPKISEGNVGFRLLSMMGWSEGGCIGFTGGLDQPLTAIIKHTKLGLGAT